MSPRASRRHPVPADEFTYEPSERRVRGTVGAVTVVDSARPVLVWEPGRAVPGYVFPRSDVRTDLLSPGSDGRFDLLVDGRRLASVAWTYDVPELADHVAFDWFGRTEPGIEHWYEEDEEIFVHPRDPYKRVDPLPSSRHVQVSINGVRVAESHRPVLVFETRLPIRYYLPREDVDFTTLQPSDLQTGCPYKGTASYWSFPGGPENVAWTYPDPVPAVGRIADLVAFYNEVVDITVDGVALDRPVTEFNRRFSRDEDPRA
ncbi:DUF427 domain-containing protein [Cryptosporangium aurantiacum]|uniref:Uncharacterized conserved protein, DUF427 family n=1 Tax=Cryptosporangium aurantiacum TaxID=134849 RepID=A0A1M7KAU4_9ACTN|nr:DUF427 domain-containing protein [Cryptosporangium aurantiacum]SHM62103.1 Uncharacterized conserved protein, DUF427 family [Cryptosporangium aurantiacum]